MTLSTPYAVHLPLICPALTQGGFVTHWASLCSFIQRRIVGILRPTSFAVLAFLIGKLKNSQHSTPYNLGGLGRFVSSAFLAPLFSQVDNNR